MNSGIGNTFDCTERRNMFDSVCWLNYNMFPDLIIFPHSTEREGLKKERAH